MTEDEKQELRHLYAGKAVSEMALEERKVFDLDFQYGFGDRPVQNPTAVKSTLPKQLPASSLEVLQQMSLLQKK